MNRADQMSWSSWPRILSKRDHHPRSELVPDRLRLGMVEVNWLPSLLSLWTRAFSDLWPLREIAVPVD